MRRGIRMTLIIVAAAAGAVSLLVVLGFLVIAAPAWVLLARGTTFDSPPAAPPLSALNVTRDHGRTTQIHASLAPGYRLHDLVDIRLFDGFTGPEPLDRAERRMGAPTGRWVPPEARAAGAEEWFRASGVHELAPYYDGPFGRVTLRPYRTPEQGIFGMPVGYPKDCSLETLFKDARLRAQIVALLPDRGVAAVNIHGSDGWGGFEVSLGRMGCTDVTLGWRD